MPSASIPLSSGTVPALVKASLNKFSPVHPVAWLVVFSARIVVAPAACSKIATERLDEENSSARIFIADCSFSFVRHAPCTDVYQPQFRADDSRQIEDAVEPFNNGDRFRWIKIRFQSRTENLLRRLQPVKV